jgi:transcriptional regulator with XRE-family HTH domain
MQKNIHDVVIHDEFAIIAESIPDWEWDLHDFTEEQSDQLHQLMEQKGITKAELARRMSVSKAFITKVLRGDANLNAKTFIRLVHALEGRAHIKIVSQKAGASPVKWFGLVQKAKEQNRPLTPLKKPTPLHCSEGSPKNSLSEKNVQYPYPLAV